MAAGLVGKAGGDGVELVSVPGGLLGTLTMLVLEAALEAEMDERLGCGHGGREAEQTGGERDGTRSKTARTEVGPIEVEAPRG
jgi:transposase-like protein